MKTPSILRTLAFFTLPCLAAISCAQACTGLALKAADGTLVSGRTAEFAVELDLKIALVPAGTAFAGTTPLGTGMTYRAKYTAIGATAFGADTVLDGLNTQGLSIGSFYFPTFAAYTPTTPENQGHSLAPSEFATWVLTQFATVAEVRAAIEAGAVAIAPTVVPAWGPVPAPFHYVVYDKTGACLVIEPLNGGLKLYDNPLGVITNSPTFDWHMTNLRNYVSLRTLDVPPITVDKTTFQPLGQGTGGFGLPGDLTPPSRFVRAAFFSATAQTPADADAAALAVLHLLNNFDIPKGASAQAAGGQLDFDYTQMTCARDPKNLRFYWKSYGNQNIQFFDLKRVAPAQLTPGVKFIRTQNTQPLADYTDAFAPAVAN